MFFTHESTRGAQVSRTSSDPFSSQKSFTHLQLDSFEQELAAVADVDHQQTQLRLLVTYRSELLCRDGLDLEVLQC